MALTSDEDRVIRARQHAPASAARSTPRRVRRDLWRLAEWERARASAAATVTARARQVEHDDLRSRSRVILDGPDRARRART